MRIAVFSLRSMSSANRYPVIHLYWEQIEENLLDKFSSRPLQEHSDDKWEFSGAPGRLAIPELRAGGCKDAFKTLKDDWDQTLRENSREALSFLSKDVDMLDRVLTQDVRLWYDRAWKDQADYKETKIEDYVMREDVLRFLPPVTNEVEPSFLKTKYGVQDSARVQEVLKLLETSDAEYREAEDL